ncbi:hypothetical protein GCK32_022780 [Trichostrongylus colubriformis]|uniref:Uncharacterized protein n=1 Tax=Trichostrongylus colubriformis TaxID=6319 RepID=A0AAN8IUJ4_TRICO
MGQLSDKEIELQEELEDRKALKKEIKEEEQENYLQERKQAQQSQAQVQLPPISTDLLREELGLGKLLATIQTQHSQPTSLGSDKIQLSLGGVTGRNQRDNRKISDI